MIQLTYHGTGFKELRRRLDPKLLDRALNAAMQKTAMKVRTHISKDVRQKYNVKAGDIAKVVKITKVKSRDGGRLIAYTSGGVGLDKFSPLKKKVKTARGLRRGVSVRIRKDRGRRLVKGAFSADVHGTKIFRRQGDSRLPIDRLYGPAIPVMVSNKITVLSVNEKVGHELPIEFERAMDRFLSRAA